MGKILVTGGTGYVGSHTCVSLVLAGYQVVIADNLTNSSVEVVARLELITGKHLRFYQADLREKESLRQIFIDNKISGVIHLADLKNVEKSRKNPLRYYENNILGLTTLLQVMEEFKCPNLVFGSTATIYDQKAALPYTEETPVVPKNPYEQTAVIMEQILQDYCVSHEEFSVAILRHYAAAGSHESGLIGESIYDSTENLVPQIAKIAVGKQDVLAVPGKSYDTPDGSFTMDYTHVTDIASGYVSALQYLENHQGLEIFNLGTCYGSSVLEMIEAYEDACGKKISYEVVEPNPERIAESYVDVQKAKEVLNWEPYMDIDDICRDSWNFIQQNPNGI